MIATRSQFRQELAKALKNKTMAADRIWHERRVPFGFEEMPAINIIFASPDQNDTDERWEYHRFTVAGVLVQDNYRCDDGGLSFAMRVDEFDAQIKAQLRCLRIPGCTMSQIERSFMEFTAEGNAMYASAWTSIVFQTEAPMFGQNF